jgi:ParB/RepB/Spo0J family partition protein
MAKWESPRAAGPSLAELPLTQVDEPELASRETFDEVKLAELAESIKANGVIQPIIVERYNGRYRIHAGHRRYLASVMAGMESIPAIVHPEGKVNGEALMLHENLYREDLNPGEEATFLAALLEKWCGQDVDKLCELVKQRRAYVEDRLLLLQGDERVLLALKERKINLSVAKEFNRYKDKPLRWAHLEAAIQGGASARMVAEWRARGELIINHSSNEPAPLGNETSAQPSVAFVMRCLVCESTACVHEMDLVYVHRGVCLQLMKRWLDAVHAGGFIGGGNENEAVERG